MPLFVACWRSGLPFFLLRLLQRDSRSDSLSNGVPGCGDAHVALDVSLFSFFLLVQCSSAPGHRHDGDVALPCRDLLSFCYALACNRPPIRLIRPGLIPGGLFSLVEPFAEWSWPGVSTYHWNDTLSRVDGV